MLGPEMGRHIGRDQPSLIIAAMPEVEQVIEYSRTHETLRAEFLDAGAAVTFRERCAVRPHQQADMSVVGAPQLQGVQQHELTRGVRQMIVAAQHMGDAHDRVVHGIAKKERGGPVLAANDEVADVAR